MAKFTSDNQPAGRGRPKGSPNKAKQLIRDATPDIIEAMILVAKEGDVQAASLVLKYAIPAIKPESQKLDLKFESDSTLSDKAELIVDAALSGECCPSVASVFIGALAQTAKIIETDEILSRLDKIEGTL